MQTQEQSNFSDEHNWFSQNLNSAERFNRDNAKLRTDTISTLTELEAQTDDGKRSSTHYHQEEEAVTSQHLITWLVRVPVRQPSRLLPMPALRTQRAIELIEMYTVAKKMSFHKLLLKLFYWSEWKRKEYRKLEALTYQQKSALLHIKEKWLV